MNHHLNKLIVEKAEGTLEYVVTDEQTQDVWTVTGTPKTGTSIIDKNSSSPIPVTSQLGQALIVAINNFEIDKAWSK
jgi:hypothetical protein